MTHDDLYRAVHQMEIVLYVLCALILVQIGAKILILGRVIALMRRVETLLILVEKHAELTDTRADRVAAAAHIAAQEARANQEEIPKRVVQLLRTDIGSHDTGTLPTVNPPETKP